MTSFRDQLMAAAAELGRALQARSLMFAAAESCTGGLLSAAITSIAGSSEWFDCGFVTYSNEAKHHMLGVPREVIAQHGAVSEQVARAMCEGALKHSRAQLAVSITGIAGPGGGSVEKPVGLVWFGFSIRTAQDGEHITTQTLQQQFTGDRATIRERAAHYALIHAYTLAKNS